MRQQRIQKLVELFVRDGFAPTYTSDGDLKIQLDERYFILRIQNHDDDYIQLLFPSIWIAINENWTDLVTAINGTNSSCKVAKLYLVENRVHATAEVFSPDVLMFYQRFPRYVEALKYAASVFAQRLTNPGV